MIRPGLLAIAACAVAVAVAPGVARGDDELAPRYAVDVPILATSLGLHVLGATVGKEALSPDACRWCDDNALDAGVRRGLVWDDTALAGTLSDVIGYGALSVIAGGGLELAAHLDGRRDEWLHNAVIVGQAVFLTANVTTLAKIAFARERPFVHALAPADKPGDVEDNLSFHSGHSSFAMSIAVAASTTATLRGYRHHRVLWATTVPLALATGYLRIAADRHWTTDVVTGWVVGAAVGFAVPYFLHRRGGAAASTEAVVVRSDRATTVGLSFIW